MDMRTCLVALIAGLSPVAAHGQLIGPVPPAPPAREQYVPPKVEPVAVEPAPVEPPAPSIVARDEQGRLRPIDGTPEEVAVRAYVLDAARREKVGASMVARRTDLDRFVVSNLEKVIEAEKTRARVESSSDYNELFKARDLNVALRYERLVDRLERDRAITMAQRVRLDETLLSYERARQEEIDREAGGDPARAGVLNLRRTFADVMREPLESLERQTRDVAAHLGELRETIKVRPEQEIGYAAAVDKDESGRAAAERFVRETMDIEQKRAAMTARLGVRGAGGK